VEAFPQRMLRGQRMQLSHQFLMTAQVERGIDPPFLSLQPQLFQARHFLPEQPFRGDVGQWRTPPQAERLPKQPVRAIPGALPQRGAAVLAQAAEPEDVYLICPGL
jgi:hypothetical protein